MIRIEHLPADVHGLTAMARAALSGRLRIEGLAVAGRLEELRPPEERFLPDERAQLAKWLEARVAAHGPHVAVLDSLRSLAEPGAACVVCGHGPGLLGTPLVVLWKALQTVKLARELARNWAVPVVPVFWNHADDHDVAAAHHSYILNRHFDVQKVKLAGLSSGRMPLSRIELREERHGLGAIRSLLRQIYGDQPGTDEAIELFAPRDGETLPQAFTRTMYELLGHTGLVVLEPEWLREELSRALAMVIGEDLQPLLRASAAELAAAGFEPAIDADHAPLVYRIDAGGRNPLRTGGDGYRYDDEPGARTRAELAAEIVQEPAAWSAGAPLAPIVSDLVLPTAAFVGGSLELALQAQIAPIRARIGLPATSFVPRPSITLIDEECRASLERLGLESIDVLQARGELELAGPAPRSQLVEELRAIGRRARRELLERREELVETDRTLGPVLRRSADGLDRAVKKLCEKVSRVQANRTGQSRRHLRRLNNTLCPRGQAQELVLGALPFVARHGREWIDELLAELDPLAPEHLVVALGPDSAAR